MKTGNELKLLKSSEVQLLNSINFPEPLTEDSVKILKEQVAGVCDVVCPVMLMLLSQKQDEYILVFIKLLNNITSDTSVTFLLYYLTILFGLFTCKGFIFLTLCFSENTPFIEAFASIGRRCENVDPIAPFLAYVCFDFLQLFVWLCMFDFRLQMFNLVFLWENE